MHASGVFGVNQFGAFIRKSATFSCFKYQHLISVDIAVILTIKL